MRVALLSTPTRTNSINTVPPFGLLYLASYVRMKGHIVTIIDIARTRQDNGETIKQLKDFNPDLIGISGIITAYRFIKKLVPDIKRSFNVPLVIGGHVTFDTDELLIKKMGFDYVVHGYGEIKLAYLIEYLEGKRGIKSIPGISYLKKDAIVTNPGDLFFKHIDECPLPAYDLIDMNHYIKAYDVKEYFGKYQEKTGKQAPPKMYGFMVIGARGCTDECSFCIHEFGGYKGFRVHSIDYIMDNIRLLYDRYGVRIFSIGEELFIYSVPQASKFVDAMNKNFPDAYFSTITRADFISDNLMKVLSNSNCFSLSFGFESGSDMILKMLNKRATKEINVNAYKLISKTSIMPAVTFMVGTPGETKQTIDETIYAIKKANILEGGLFFTTPYPGSRLFRWCVENKYIIDVDEYLEKISNHDASTLQFNFTPFPDIVVLMMYIKIKNAMYKNRKNNGRACKITFKNFIVEQCLVPILFELYFFARRNKNNTLNYALNSKETVMLLSDCKKK